MNITIHLLGRVCSSWEAVRLMVVHTGFPKCSSCIISDMLSVFSFAWQTLHLFLTMCFPDIQTWLNIIFKVKVRFKKQKHQNQLLQSASPFPGDIIAMYFGMPKLCECPPLPSDRMLKRYMYSNIKTLYSLLFYFIRD